MNTETAIVLPLGVVANQLMRIEAELRLLNMKALDLAKEREDGRFGGLIEAKLENISEALEAIRSLVSDIQTDIRPRSASALAAPVRSSSEAVEPDHSKSHPARDD